jgi:glycosyltransferase involved in cell wall biosynthesis
MIKRQNRLRKIEDEAWKYVPESNNRYMVSNYGRVKSFIYDKEKGRIMNLSLTNNFYTIKLKIDKQDCNYFIHKLVASLWLQKPSELHNHVIHIDWNSKNNHLSNLAWATKAEVIERIAKRQREKIFSPNYKKQINNSKLKEQDVVLLKSMLQRGVPHVKIAKLFCISDMQVTRIKRGENWGHVKVGELETQDK